MKHFFFKAISLIILLIIQLQVLSQSRVDYTIHFSNGKITPSYNVNDAKAINKTYAKSAFASKYFVVIQFNELPTASQKKVLQSSGISLVDYLPNLAYTATLSTMISQNELKAFNVRSIFNLSTAQKTTADVLFKKVPAYAIAKVGFADISIQMFTYLDKQSMAASFKTLQAEVISDVPVFKMYTLRLPIKNLPQLVAMPYVQWAEYIAPPNTPENLPGRTLHRVNVLNDGVRNLKGDGMNIGVWDERASQHLDFSPAGRMVNVDAGAAGSHGTHVSGTIGGKGIINPVARGMAPNAKIYSYYGFSGDVQAAMASAIPANTLISSNHSYHDGLGVQCGVTGASAGYSLRARNTDINLNNNDYHLHCHSAGNAQTSCASGWGTITGTGKAAKNNIVVANITTTELISGSSSYGPVHDGRVKPEISAMGTNVLSTYTPLNTYSTISGTSMSTPGITGTLALLAQRYKQLNANALPPSTLIKNIACNTAIDLGNEGPDYRFGFGRINALAAVKILEQNRYVLSTIATGATNDVTLAVPAGAARLNVMLTWNDPAAAANASIALVNNLNLTVVNGANTTLPWILNPESPATPATKAVDNVSNIEQVTINNPTAGTYTFKVKGEAITTGATQSYALSWNVDMPYIEVIYPNGNESFSPSTSEVITWDNAGITGTQTVEYSLDNGATYTLISSTVPAATTRLTWAVPAASTATALIRISAGGITDVSDANFKILGTVTGFGVIAGGGCAAGQINFTWNAVTNATAYDIYKLNEVTGDFALQASNITTTTHTATGFTAGEVGWFYIIAKNTTTNAVGMRSVAINATASTAGGLGAVGTITGQTSVCGAPSNVNYTLPAVTGATTYTWAVPSGATIASGQGSTSILVNFSASATSGNISVFASNGTCQTSPNTLAVTAGSAAVPQPATSGNQTQVVCPGAATPTLTATATTIAGNSIVWYNAAIGGTIITNPTLNTAGTINYYAAAKSTANGCESINRTLVTLTITQVAPATISANSNTSFCQGGTVTLNASPNAQWLWSNGATTQSIVVNTQGNYSVTGTTGSCTSSSAPTSVTVNALPAANITANGATTFCQGASVLLAASTGASYLWSNGANTATISPTTTGNYSVTVTNANGCSATSSSTSIIVNANPAAVISANAATTFCAGGSVTLSANTGNTYLWSNGATTQNITVTNTGMYSVAVTQVGGCVSNSVGALVTVNQLPVAAITANGSTNFCQGASVVLAASNGAQWLWSNGATTQNITVNNSGNYTVVVSNASGCTAISTSTNVAVSANPMVSITTAPYTSLYPGLITALTANVQPAGNYNYTWFKNNIPVNGATTATLGNIDVNKLGSYTVTVTNASGLACSKTANAVVIKDSASTQLFIYPSPNAGLFKVSYYTPNANAKNSLVIYDAKGALVYSKQYVLLTPYQTMDVNMQQNGKGTYRVMLLNSEGKKIAVGTVVIL